MKQTIRIIGGQYRGKKLHFPDNQALRPTPDRVRETVFNWLMHDIRNARCLDAFAGSGALGFEAFSRGAASVVLVEKSAASYTNLKQIATAFNSTHLTVINADARDYLKQTTEQFDIVFLDPPFATEYLRECLTLLEHSKVLSEQGLVYMESAEEVSLDSTIWCALKLKKAGNVMYGLYKRTELTVIF